MIHLSMPLRPRVNVRCEYLTTPISIALEDEGKKILCLSDVKATDDRDHTTEYIEILSKKVGVFDLIIKDSDLEFRLFALNLINQTLSPYKNKVTIRSCSCGAYEELENVRMFDLRRVSNNTCVFCGTELHQKESEVLLSNILWIQCEEFQCNRSWVTAELKCFLGRQTKTYKISKQNEIVKLFCDGLEFGVRYQILWASLIVYLVNLTGDFNVTMHFVHKVQGKAFFICSLAKMMCPDIRFHLKALPIIWLKESPIILDSLPSQIKLLGKALSTKRKELQISLETWRF